MDNTSCFDIYYELIVVVARVSCSSSVFVALIAQRSYPGETASQLLCMDSVACSSFAMNRMVEFINEKLEFDICHEISGRLEILFGP
jgi:hypothetical protein